ncbi:MAG: N-acetylgalactosamine 6-sulfatase (GALNS), partial [Verrucomicrobiota bacterium]
GRNVLPALQGEVDHLHDHLFWSSGGLKGTWAVRSGKWKLTGVKGESWLYDLEADISEEQDRSADHPEVVADLQKAFDGWIADMGDPLSGQAKVWDPNQTPKKKLSKEEKKARDAQKAARKAMKEANDKEKEARKTAEEDQA